MQNTEPESAPRYTKQQIIDCFQTQGLPGGMLWENCTGVAPNIFSKASIDPVAYTMKGYQVSKLSHIFSRAKRTISAHKPPKPIPKQSLISSPFRKSGLISDCELRIWQYQDESGNTQGPFTALEMDNWFNRGFFHNKLPIKLKAMSGYMKLADMLFHHTRYSAKSKKSLKRSPKLPKTT